MAPAEAWYLYGVVAAGGELPPGAAGVAGAPVRLVREGALAAAVSPLEGPRLRPERRHLAAHQEVLRALLGRGPLLPVSFGTVAGKSLAVRRFLRRHQAELVEQLRRVSGKFEMTVRVVWDVPNIFEYFVTLRGELRAARDRLFGAAHEPTHGEKLALGRLFQQVLEEERERRTAQVEEVLLPHCADLRRNDCRGETQVMDLACLLRRGSEAEFETALLEAARGFDNNFAFDYSGPWPPYHFVALEFAP